MNMIPVIMLLTPLVGCGLIAAGVAPAKRLALVTVMMNLALAFMMAGAYPVGARGYAFEFDMPWVVGMLDFFNIHFHTGVDGISLPLVLLNAVVSVAAVSVAHETIKRAREFFICVLLISMGAHGAFISLDLFFLYVFHEIALIPTFLLIGIWGTHDRKFAAWQITLYLMFGSLVLLLGILALYFSMPYGMRTLDLVQIQHLLMESRLGAGTQSLIFILLLVGFGTLVSLWPFHSWAAPGYASAPPSAAMLHAGVLKKFGLYGLLRVAVPYMPEGMDAWMNVLLVLLVMNVLYVGLVTVAQKDFGWMLGYSSVMHMGYLFLGIASLNVIGVTGAVVLMVGHGLSTAMLFGLAGEIRQRTGTLSMSELGGVAQKAPQLGLLVMIAALASIGLPGLANFAGEILIFFGAWRGFPLATVAALFGVIISAVYMLRATKAVLFTEPSAAVASMKDFKNAGQSWPYVMLAACLLVVGFYPGILIQWVQPSVNDLLALKEVFVP